MEKNNKETLALFAAELEDLKERLAALEARFAGLTESLMAEEENKVVEEEDDDPGIVDIDIVDLPVAEVTTVGKLEDDFPEDDDLPEDVPAVLALPADALTESFVTEPIATEPVVTEPAAPEVPSEPAATEPLATEPSAPEAPAEPAAVAPAATEAPAEAATVVPVVAKAPAEAATVVPVVAKAPADPAAVAPETAEAPAGPATKGYAEPVQNTSEPVAEPDPESAEASSEPAAVAPAAAEAPAEPIATEPVATEPAAPEATKASAEPATVPSATELLAPTGSYPWQTAKPGMPVKNLRSGISLFDRALFINTLFKEDYVLYDKSISDLNALSSFAEAVDYVLRHFPDWNLSSDVVYSFMMALRKKLL